MAARTIDIKVLKDLRCPLANRQRAGDRPPRYDNKKAFLSPVGRGPVPRHHSRARFPRHAAFAGDRPPRYGARDAYRRARDRPAHHLCRAGSPDPAVRDQAIPNYREGASRGTGPRATETEEASRGTGPRATVIGAFLS